MEIIEATATHIPELFNLWTEFFDYHRDIDPYYTRSEDAREHIEKRSREKIRFWERHGFEAKMQCMEHTAGILDED